MFHYQLKSTDWESTSQRELVHDQLFSSTEFETMVLQVAPEAANQIARPECYDYIFQGKIVELLCERFGFQQIEYATVHRVFEGAELQRREPIQDDPETERLRERLHAEGVFSLESIAKRLREHHIREQAEWNGWVVNPDMVETISKGLARNILKYEQMYCPCQVIPEPPLDLETFKRLLSTCCPCDGTKEIIERDGRCKCFLFLKSEETDDRGESQETAESPAEAGQAPAEG